LGIYGILWVLYKSVNTYISQVFNANMDFLMQIWIFLRDNIVKPDRL